MSIEDVRRCISLMEGHEVDFDGPKDIDLIAKAEQALGLVFPPSYKLFLSKLGCGDVNGLEFYGIVDEEFVDSGIPDGIWLTLTERKGGLPDNFVIVYALDDGSYLALDVSETDRNNENPVIQYWSTGETVRFDRDFGSFFLSEVQTSFG